MQAGITEANLIRSALFVLKLLIGFESRIFCYFCHLDSVFTVNVILYNKKSIVYSLRVHTSTYDSFSHWTIGADDLIIN